MSEEDTSSTSNVAQAAERAQQDSDKVSWNSSAQKLMELSKELGLVDADLCEFVRDQQEYEREERRLQHEAC